MYEDKDWRASKHMKVEIDMLKNEIYRDMQKYYAKSRNDSFTDDERFTARCMHDVLKNVYERLRRI